MGLCLGCELPTEVLNTDRCVHGGVLGEIESTGDSHLGELRSTRARNTWYYIPLGLQGGIVAECDDEISGVILFASTRKKT